MLLILSIKLTLFHSPHVCEANVTFINAKYPKLMTSLGLFTSLANNHVDSYGGVVFCLPLFSIFLFLFFNVYIEYYFMFNKIPMI